MSLLETMAMGLCVVAPDTPTHNEYISDGITGLLYDLADVRPLSFLATPTDATDRLVQP
jgi:glycosyltransferase involved in cell wall biosynthesis